MSTVSTPQKALATSDSDGVATNSGAVDSTPQKGYSTVTTTQNTSASKAYASPASKKHEDFKNKLVHDVFGRDNKGKVPMEKVAMLIWQFRDDPAVVQFMAQFVAKVRRVHSAVYYATCMCANTSFGSVCLPRESVQTIFSGQSS